SHFSAYLTLWFPLLIWWTPLCLIRQILTRRFRLYAYGITGKELSIFSSRLNANKFPVVIDWLSKGLIKPEKLITHTFDFQHVADAISLFEQDQKHCCKVLLTFSE
ncbi:hypothetical protein OYA94_26115, partial [Escherichia coli]|nr:hypothetical protein [Escherichia coli]